MTPTSGSGTSVPSYQQLLERTDGPPGASWGMFGSDDGKGSVNFMTPERIVAAARLVSRGRVFNLDYPVNGFDPPLWRRRGHAKHHIFSRHADHRDDWLDNFYLQSTSQIDGLRHRRHNEHGFYNGVADAEISEETSTLGINEWAESGIIGRGVLLDVGRYLASQGAALSYETGDPIEVELLDRVATAQGVKFLPGDILMIRTGWCEYLLHEASHEYRVSLQSGARCPGVVQARETLAWLWDHQFVAVSADNIAFEVLPPVASSPFVTGTDGGLMHQEMIAMLGLAIGELWRLDELAADSLDTGTYECLVVSKPLNVRGGVGSPANAVAIR